MSAIFRMMNKFNNKEKLHRNEGMVEQLEQRLLTATGKV